MYIWQTLHDPSSRWVEYHLLHICLYHASLYVTLAYVSLWPNEYELYLPTIVKLYSVWYTHTLNSYISASSVLGVVSHSNLLIYNCALCAIDWHRSASFLRRHQTAFEFGVYVLYTSSSLNGIQRWLHFYCVVSIAVSVIQIQTLNVELLVTHNTDNICSSYIFIPNVTQTSTRARAIGSSCEAVSISSNFIFL